MKTMTKGSPYLYPGLNKFSVVEQIKELRTTEYQFVMDFVLKVVNNENDTDYTMEDVRGKGRKRELVDIRHCICYVSRTYFEKTLQGIGRFINRDHSSVINGIKIWCNLMDTDNKYKRIDNKIVDRIHKSVRYA